MMIKKKPEFLKIGAGVSLFILVLVLVWLINVGQQQTENEAQQTIEPMQTRLTESVTVQAELSTQLTQQAAKPTRLPTATVTGTITASGGVDNNRVGNNNEGQSTVTVTPSPLPAVAEDSLLTSYTKAVSRYLASQAALLRFQSPNQLRISALLAVESQHRFPNSQADETIRYALRWLPRSVTSFIHEPTAAGDTYIRSLALSPNGRYLLTAGPESVYLWQLPEGEKVHHLTSEFSGYQALFSPNGDYAAILSSGNVVIWSVETGAVVMGVAWLYHDRFIEQFAFSPDSQYVATASRGDIRIWAIAPGSPQQVTHIESEQEIIKLAFTPDGQYIFSLTQEEWEVGQSALWVWEAQTGNLVRQWETAHGPPTVFVISQDGRYLATIDRQVTQVWDLAAGPQQAVELARLPVRAGQVAFQPDHESIIFTTATTLQRWSFMADEAEPITIIDEPVSSFTLSPDGQLLAGRGRLADTHVARIWHLSEDKEIARIPYSDRLWQIAFIPETSYLITAGLNDGIGRADLWQFDPWDGLQLDLTLPAHVDAAVFSADGQLIAAGSQSGEMALWSLSSQAELVRFHSDNGGVTKLLFSPDDAYLAVAWDQSLYLLETTEGTMVNSLPYAAGEGHYLRAIAFSPDARYLASASYDRTVRLWDVPSGTEVMQFRLDSAVMAVAFTLDSQQIVTAQSSGLIQVWALTGQQEVARFQVSSDGYGPQLALSPDGRLLAVYVKGDVWVWHLADQALVMHVTNQANFRAALFSPDSQFLITLSLDGRARIWDWATQEMVAFWVLPYSVRTLSMSADGRYLVAPDQRATYIWDMDLMQAVATVPHAPQMDMAVLSPDNRFLLTGAQLWLWQPQDLLPVLCQRVGQNLSLDSWYNYLADEPYHQTCPQWP